MRAPFSQKGDCVTKVHNIIMHRGKRNTEHQEKDHYNWDQTYCLEGLVDNHRTRTIHSYRGGQNGSAPGVCGR